MKSRNLRTTSRARSAPNRATPAKTSGPSGWSWSSSAVTTPKLPPPPRSAQSSSVFSRSETRMIRPSQVTSSAPTRLSHARPSLRSSHPEPPPSVSPATPVVETRPPVVARPWAWVTRSTSAQMAPPPTLTMRRSTSTSMSAMPRMSSTTPSSHSDRPATECPPARTAIGKLVLAGERHSRHDVVDGDALDHEPGAAVDHGVEERARGFVELVAGLVHAALQAEAELVDTRDEVGCGHGTSLRPITCTHLHRNRPSCEMAETGQSGLVARAVPHGWRVRRQLHAMARRAWSGRSRYGDAPCAD